MAVVAAAVVVTRLCAQADVRQWIDRGAGGSFVSRHSALKRLLLSRAGRPLGHVRFIPELNAKRLADL